MLNYAQNKISSVIDTVANSSAGYAIDNILTSERVWQPVFESYSALKKANSFIGNNQLFLHTTAFIAFGLIESTVRYYTAVTINQYADKVLQDFFALAPNKNDAESFSKANDTWLSFQDNLLYYLEFALAQVALNQFISYLSTITERKLRHRMESKTDEMLYKNQNLMVVTRDEEIKTISSMYEGDLIGNTFIANNLVRSLAGTTHVGFLALRDLLNFNFLIPGFVVCYGLTNQYFASMIAYKTKEINMEIEKLSVKLTSKRNHVLNNAGNIIRSGGEEYERKEIEKFREAIRAEEEKLIRWNIANSCYSTLSGYLNFATRFLLLGYNLKIGAISKEDRAIVEVAQSNFNSFVDFRTDNLSSLVQMHTQRERVTQTSEVIEKAATAPKTLHIEFNPSQKEAIKITNFSLTINDEKVLNLGKFSLEKGKCYVISGPTGRGKSTFLGKLKGITADPMPCKGKITYAATSNNDILLVPQSDYFPLDKKLIEAICYPYNPKEDSKRKIEILLDESGLSNLKSRLDEVGNFTNTLSGGQKKIIKIISAILVNPKILLLDETLTGLDNKVSTIIQKLIKDHLPNATVLVVDHNIESNNRIINGKKFYDEALTFERGTIVKSSSSIAR